MVTKNYDQVPEMKRRMGQGWSAICKLDNIMRDTNVPMTQKRKAFNECILPVMTYGCETWSLSNTQPNKLVTPQRKMGRITVGVTLKDRKSTNWIGRQSGVIDIIANIRKANAGSWSTWREETTDGQSESQNGYPADIKDLEADQEGDSMTTLSDRQDLRGVTLQKTESCGKHVERVREMETH